MPARFLCVVALWIVSVMAQCAPCRAADKDTTAEQMMRTAHLARSGWGSDFPGFRADVRVTIDGEQAAGEVTIDADGAVDLKLPAGAQADWAREQLESIAMHRRAETRDRYDVSFADEVTTHPLGRLIRFHGGSTHTLYRIKGDVITEVHRTMGDSRFTISVTEIQRNDRNQTLPRHFNVSYWNVASGQLEANHDFADRWVHLDQHDLPHSRLLIRTSQKGRQVSEMVLSNHQLLKSP
jgi:hypothetical protein